MLGEFLSYDPKEKKLSSMGSRTPEIQFMGVSDSTRNWDTRPV